MTQISILRRLAALLTIAVLCASPAASQGFKWWQSDEYRRELGLTADQTKRLEDIFQSAVPTLKAQKKTLDQVEAEFEKLIERGGDAAVMEQVNHLETARAELSKSRTWMLLRMRQVLTTDQWAKFTALQHQAAQRAMEAAQRAAQAAQRGAPQERER
jgi:Spy/CpxP family protein refolding chaperone